MYFPANAGVFEQFFSASALLSAFRFPLSAFLLLRYPTIHFGIENTKGQAAGVEDDLVEGLEIECIGKLLFGPCP